MKVFSVNINYFTNNVRYFGKKAVLVEKKFFLQQRFFAVVVCQYVECYIDKKFSFFQIETVALDDFDSYLLVLSFSEFMATVKPSSWILSYLAASTKILVGSDSDFTTKFMFFSPTF